MSQLAKPTQPILEAVQGGAPEPNAMKSHITGYVERLHGVLASADWSPVEQLADVLLEAVHSRRNVFLCGNGGSAGNATHLANDFLYGKTFKICSWSFM